MKSLLKRKPFLQKHVVKKSNKPKDKQFTIQSQEMLNTMILLNELSYF